jgi:predicted  nucleic acid-binding Zn-ribbon protein
MPDDIPVLSSQLQEMQNEMKDFFMKELNKLTKEVQNNNHSIESANKRVSTLTTRIEQLESMILTILRILFISLMVRSTTR